MTEDDADTRDLVALLITNNGFEVVTAEDSQHALTMARTESFDLYLLDP